MVAISKLNGLYLATQQAYQGLATPEQLLVHQYNILNFLGGFTPYKQFPGYGIDTDIPQQCKVEQVHLLSRHGERYPTKSDGRKFEAIMKKFNSYNDTFAGDLDFLNLYEYFVPDKSLYEMETTPENSQGLFAGTSDAARHGMYFRAKYKLLYDDKTNLTVFTANSRRVHTTAKAFARGFMGDAYEKQTEWVVVAEDKDAGANTLTPRLSCPNFVEFANPDIVLKYNLLYLDRVAERLNKQNKGLGLNSLDINNLFFWCAFEINVRGSLPMCGIFSNEDFVRWAYYTDLLSYYAHGEGYNMTGPLGKPYWLTALRMLLQKDPKNKIVLTFTHDTDIEIFLASVGLFNVLALATDHVMFPSPYPRSHIVPQGARVYLEKYACANELYVRFILNDAVIPLTSCQNGPGFSCEFSKFKSIVTKRMDSFPDFDKACGTNATNELSFYLDYTNKTYFAEDIDA